METFKLEITNGRNIKFTGELIAHCASSSNSAMGSWYSGHTGIWQVLDLYKTASGKFVCHQSDMTQWQGERNTYSGEVCETESEVIDFFGHSWLAKEIYCEAEIDDCVEV